MSQLDVDHGAGIASGVSNTAGATGTTPAAVVYNIPNGSKATATTTIPAGPKLTIAKVAVITTDTNANGKADLGDVVTYTYTVSNTGNVSMTAVSVNDMHGTPAVAVPLGAGGHHKRNPYGARPAWCWCFNQWYSKRRHLGHACCGRHCHLHLGSHSHPGRSGPRLTDWAPRGEIPRGEHLDGQPGPNT